MLDRLQSLLEVLGVAGMKARLVFGIVFQTIKQACITNSHLFLATLVLRCAFGK